MQLSIDYREKKLIALLKEKIKSEDLDTPNLDLGDIVFQIKNNDELIYELIIERKSVKDLVSSIKDNRYKEQKIRLLSYKKENSHNIEIVYLLEGTKEKLRNPEKEKNMYHGSIISLLFRDNIKILHSLDIEESSEIIYRIYNRLKKNMNEFGVEIKETTKTINITNKTKNNNDYLASRIMKKKSDNITPDNVSSLMLTYLPGVSIHLSTEIMKHFDSKINNLICYINDSSIEEKEKIKYLSKLKIKSTSGKERNIGPSITNNLLNYLKK